MMRSRALTIVTLAVAACGPPASRAPIPTDPLMSISAEQLFERGLAFEGAGDLIRAEQYLSAAMERGHSDVELIEPLLRVCLRASRFGAALVHAERYLRTHREDWRMRYLVATLYVAVGHPTAAEGHLHRVIEEQPNQAQPHLALARLYASAGSDSRAAKHYRSYLALGIDGDDAYAAKAWLLHWQEERADRNRRLQPIRAD